MKVKPEMKTKTKARFKHCKEIKKWQLKSMTHTEGN
jgi:hypothetical protein